MSDIRLLEYKMPFEGKEYILRCNMNVLADVQEQNGGFMPEIFDEKRTLSNFLVYLAAMMNDYADEQGWEERFTPKQLGRKISLTDGILIQEVMKLVIRSQYIEAETDDEEPNSKN